MNYYKPPSQIIKYQTQGRVKGSLQSSFYMLGFKAHTWDFATPGRGGGGRGGGEVKRRKKKRTILQIR
jgi:hypothetical protein